MSWLIKETCNNPRRYINLTFILQKVLRWISPEVLAPVAYCASLEVENFAKTNKHRMVFLQNM